jgi:UDP-N-acetylglucosamine 4,6-dehydratase
MKDDLADKTLLVTGGTGSIGSEIVKHILSHDVSKVIVFSRDEIKHFLMKKRISDGRLETVVGDIRNSRSLEPIFYKFNIDLIYHAAAMKHVVMCEDFPLEAVETNIVGTQNIADLAIKYGVPKMITISTDKAAYPANVMGAAKFIAEKITLNANKLSRGNQAFSCVRFGNVASSRGSVIPIYLDNLFNHVPLQVTDPEVTRFVISVSDAVSLIMKATGYAQGGEIFILKMKAFKLSDLVDVMVNVIAPKLNISKEDVKVNITGLAFGEKLHEDLINELESPRTYERDDIYVILPDDKARARSLTLNKANFLRYSSKKTELISKQQIEELVMDYLGKRTPDC